MRNTSIALALLLFVFVAGCKDPSSGKPRATVGSAVAEAADRPASSDESSITYAFDNDGSRIDWVGSKVTLAHDGGFERFSGTFDVPDGDITRGRVEVVVQLDSVWSDTEKLTGHLKSPDFFDTEKHKTSSFTSTKIEKGGEGDATHTVTGNLDLNGVRKSVTFPAKIEVTEDGFEASAEFTLDRKSFGITYPGMPDDLIADGVVIKLDVDGKSR